MPSDMQLDVFAKADRLKAKAQELYGSKAAQEPAANRAAELARQLAEETAEE